MVSFNELIHKSGLCIKAARAFILTLLILSFATVFLQVEVVRADPITVNVFPASAPVGASFSVYGVNATAGGEVRLYVLDYLYFASTVANETGGYSVNMVVPAVPMESYSILALDVASGNTASAMLNVEPRILITPNEGSYADQVSVKGEGFSSYSEIIFTLDGDDVSPFPPPYTDNLGSFSASFTVPSRTNGTYEFTAYGPWGDIASAPFNVTPKLILWPTSGEVSTVGYVQGFGFNANVNVTVFFGSFDVTPYPWMTTEFDGSWGMPFFIPDVADGFHTISATDDTGLSATAQFIVPGPILTLTPNRTSDSSVITARGMGFQPRTPILLYLEDIMMTGLIDLMMESPNLVTENDGSFEYSFIMPVANPGLYTVGAYMMTEPPPAEPIKAAEASIIIVDHNPLGVEVSGGSIHFRGEIAEFYVETSFSGKPFDATINSAKLYWNGTLKQDLTENVEHVAAGLYRIPYLVSGDAPTGTYNLAVEASYTTALTDAFGTSSGSFLLSAGFSEQNAKLIDVQGKIGTIVVPDLGVIKANLTTINARLVSIDGKEATIQSDLGTLTASADAINAKVTSIEGNVATISSDLGTIKSQMTNQPTDYTEPATLILSIVAAVGAMGSLFYVRKIKPSPAVTATSKPPETPPPAPTKEEPAETAEKEEQAIPIQEETPAASDTTETQTPREEAATNHEAPLETPPAPETPPS